MQLWTAHRLLHRICDCNGDCTLTITEEKNGSNFRRFTSNNVAGNTTVFTTDSFDTIVGINVANVTASAVTASVFINDGSNDIHLVKDVDIPSKSALQVLDGGAKFVVQSGDALKAVSSAASSLDVWVSTVDAISS